MSPTPWAEAVRSRRVRRDSCHFLNRLRGITFAANQKSLRNTISRLLCFLKVRARRQQQHIVRAFRFELSKVQVPAIRKRVISQLRNVAVALAKGVADGLGMEELPEPPSPVLEKLQKPEITRSPALSLLSRPGVDGIKTRRVAIILSDGANTDVASQIHAGLVAQGAVPRFLGVKLGAIEDTSGTLDIEASLEILPSVLWDGVVMLDGPTPSLCESGQAVEFLKDQYRHCKPILIFSGARALLEKLGLTVNPNNGPVDRDPGLLAFDEDASEAALSAFVSALMQHRNFERETDPPRV